MGGHGLVGTGSNRSNQSDQFGDIRLSDIGALSEEFLENMPEGAARAGQGAIDSQALAALNNPNRIRRTSSDAVLAMLSGESVALPTDAPPPQPVAASGGIGIQRTSSDALMTFLAETETNV